MIIHVICHCTFLCISTTWGYKEFWSIQNFMLRNRILKKTGVVDHDLSRPFATVHRPPLTQSWKICNLVLPWWLRGYSVCLQCGRPGFGNGNPLQYSCLENPMDGGAWWATVHRIARSRHNWATSLHFTLYFQGMSVSIEMSFYREDVSGFGIFIWLELGWKAVGRIVLKTPFCVQKTIIELFRLQRNRWIKLQRLKPERENKKNNNFLFSTIKWKTDFVPRWVTW